MRPITACLLAVLLIFAMSPALGSALTLTGPQRGEMTEGHEYPITWSSDASIKTVRVVVYGNRTLLGSRSRGRFVIQVAKTEAIKGQYEWTVPWIDSIDLTVKLKAYGRDGNLAVTSERPYRFRPAVLENRFKDGIYLDLHKSSDQRLYVQKDRRIVKASLSSSSENYLWRAANQHPKAPHDHAGVFKVIGKRRNYHSREYDVPMPYAMRYLSGHFIHATSRNLYRYLGRPASHGCNRLTRRDAMELYWTTTIGTRVEVIGPKG